MPPAPKIKWKCQHCGKVYVGDFYHTAGLNMPRGCKKDKNGFHKWKELGLVETLEREKANKKK